MAWKKVRPEGSNSKGGACGVRNESGRPSGTSKGSYPPFVVNSTSLLFASLQSSAFAQGAQIKWLYFATGSGEDG
jgi:hypothetical protein